MRTFLPIRLAAGVALGPGCGQAQVKLTLKSVSVDLPAGDRMFPDGLGTDAINNNCLACHSAGMVLNQPALPEAEVDKMRTSYRPRSTPRTSTQSSIIWFAPRARIRSSCAEDEEPPLTAQIRRRQATVALSAVRDSGTDGSNPSLSSRRVNKLSVAKRIIPRFPASIQDSTTTTGFAFASTAPSALKASGRPVMPTIACH